MRNFLKVSISNLVGLIASLVFIGILLELTRQQGGYFMPLAEAIGIDPGKFGAIYNPLQFSILFGAILAIVVSFIVSHLVEKFLSK